MPGPYGIEARLLRRWRRLALRGGEEVAGILILWVEPQDILTMLAHQRPVTLGDGGFSLIEEAVDLALDAFAWHALPPGHCQRERNRNSKFGQTIILPSEIQCQASDGVQDALVEPSRA